MSRFTAIVCDRCDARDTIDGPHSNNIKAVEVIVRLLDNNINKAPPPEVRKCDLCLACREVLQTAIHVHTQQAPSQA